MTNARKKAIKLYWKIAKERCPFHKEEMANSFLEGFIDCAEYLLLQNTELDEISGKVIEEQEAKDLLSAINCYLLCDFGVQDIEMQAQAAAEKERILKIQEKLKRIIGE